MGIHNAVGSRQRNEGEHGGAEGQEQGQQGQWMAALKGGVLGQRRVPERVLSLG